jgi:hypothetical protein
LRVIGDPSETESDYIDLSVQNVSAGGLRQFTPESFEIYRWSTVLKSQALSGVCGCPGLSTNAFLKTLLWLEALSPTQHLSLAFWFVGLPPSRNTYYPGLFLNHFMHPCILLSKTLHTWSHNMLSLPT